MAQGKDERVSIRRGIQKLFEVGPVQVGVDRITGQRALIITTPAGLWPVPINHEQYLELGISIIRDSGCVHDFSEPMPEAVEQPQPGFVPPQLDFRPPEIPDEQPPPPYEPEVFSQLLKMRPDEG